jgi:hypothetical protein
MINHAWPDVDDTGLLITFVFVTDGPCSRPTPKPKPKPEVLTGSIDAMRGVVVMYKKGG